MGVSFSRLSSECFKGVTKVFQGCLKSVSTVYPEGFKDVSRKFKVKFSRVFQGCYCISCDAGDVLTNKKVLVCQGGQDRTVQYVG